MSTAESIDETAVVRQAADNERMKAHIVCGTCYPESIPMGTPAVCGERVLGVVPRPPYETCEACTKSRYKHALSHMQGR